MNEAQIFMYLHSKGEAQFAKILADCPPKIRQTVTFEQNSKGEYIDSMISFLHAVFQSGVHTGVTMTVEIIELAREN